MKIIYQDKNLAIIDKPAGLLVHPTDKKEKDTLAHQIINKWPTLRQDFGRQADQSRLGIVHRLDKDTSGLLIIAKNPKILKFLQDQFKKRIVKKIYWALVLGKVEPKQGEIITQITRDKKGKSIKQRISSFNLSWQKSKKAETAYKVIKYYKHKHHILSLLELEIKTGRTHQIRAHLKHKGWPIIGDMLYNNKISKTISEDLKLARQFLHSKKIEFLLPSIEQKIYQSPLPEKLSQILDKLEIL